MTKQKQAVNNIPKRKMKKQRYTYVFLDYLAPCPTATEEKVAIVINWVPGSNHTIHTQRPFEAAFNFYDFNEEDLQGIRDDTIV